MSPKISSWCSNLTHYSVLYLKKVALLTQASELNDDRKVIAIIPWLAWWRCYLMGYACQPQSHLWCALRRVDQHIPSDTMQSCQSMIKWALRRPLFNGRCDSIWLPFWFRTASRYSYAFRCSSISSFHCWVQPAYDQHIFPRHDGCFLFFLLLL